VVPVEFFALLNEWLWQALMQFLQALAQWQPPLNLLPLQGWQLVVIYALLFYGLLSRGGWRQKLQLIGAVGLIAVLPKLWPFDESADGFKLTLLDVGQGQSLVVETADRVAILDTGSRWNDHYNGANLAILPYLRYQGITKVDHLLISHGDMDHTGGTGLLVQSVEVGAIFSGEPWRVAERAGLSASRVQSCFAGQEWQWQGVRFQVLAPAKDWPFKSENDRSCVVRVSNEQFSALVMGDATVKVEKWLLQNWPASVLQADILVAGHHGSRTSTSRAFLEVVRPKWVWFSSGFQNQFHFPSQTVLKRLESLAIPWQNTAQEGALSALVSSKGVQLSSYRQQNRYWYHSK